MRFLSVFLSVERRCKNTNFSWYDKKKFAEDYRNPDKHIVDAMFPHSIWIALLASTIVEWFVFFRNMADGQGETDLFLEDNPMILEKLSTKP